MREKLLIVDDEPGIVEMMASYFAPQYQVLTARSGAGALEKAGAGPDLILLDINMPGMDGLTVCQTVRDHIACPILFLTARVGSADKIAGFQAGARCAFSESWRWTMRPGRSRLADSLSFWPGRNLTFWSCCPSIRARFLTGSVSMRRFGDSMGKAAAIP